MPPPPKQLSGASVLLWTDDVRQTHSTGRTVHRAGGAVLGPAAALAICQYDNDSQYYLFYCDENWSVQTDTCHASIDEAQAQAEFEYEGVSALWRTME
jgi:hypothetical protein